MNPASSPQKSLSHRNGLRRRDFLTFLGKNLGAVAGLSAISSMTGQLGCTTGTKEPVRSIPDLVIGQRGLSDGRFQKPRAIAIDANDLIYVVDKTGRVQVFDSAGKFVRGWATPNIENGKPTGISVDRDGTIMVADTHYYRFLFYTDQGELIEEKTIGGVNGAEPGEFAFVTDIVRTPTGEYYCGEYGEYDRIHRYSSDGKFIDRMGEHGTEPLQFSRPQSLNVDQEGLLWIADACNHRIQVIDWRDSKPRLVKTLGSHGTEPGQFQLPYSLVLSHDNSIIVSEYGNHRVQKLDRNGVPKGSWGSAGSAPGELNQPWAVAVDSKNRVYVVDSGNNRVQRFAFKST
jgi:DNA-binding beta-propeller fold protein YncE